MKINLTRTISLFSQYQRWLYPVDKNRLDDGTGQITEVDNSATANDTKKAIESKKTN